MTTKILDRFREDTISDSVVELVSEELGYPPEEAIPGLVRAIKALAKLTLVPDEVLDDAANLLSEEDDE